MGSNNIDKLRFHPLTTSDQDLVWKLLSLAAHEDSVGNVKAQKCLVPFANDFGKHKGDLGVVATLPAADGEEPTVVGGAWMRLLGSNGMSTGAAGDDGEKDVPELAMAVFAEQRGKGFGYQILRELLETARQKGETAICLSCRVDNVAAMRLYERHGFKRIPNSEVTNRVGGTSVSMRAALEREEDASRLQCRTTS